MERCPPTPPAVEQALLAAAAAPRPPTRIPDRLPLVPLRSALLWVGAVSPPLSLSRPSSRAAAARALTGERLIGVFSQIDAAKEAPGESDLYRVGALGHVSTAVPHEAGLWLVVRGLAWVRLVAIETMGPFAVARVEPFVVHADSSPEAARLEQALRARVQAFAATLPDPAPVLAEVARMSALELADATVAKLTCSLAAKASYVSESSLLERLRQALVLSHDAL